VARLKGREVLLELMETAAKLEAGATAHAEKLEALAVHAGQAAAEMAALRIELREFAKAVRSMEQRVKGVEQRVGSLEPEFHAISQGFVDTAKFTRTHQQQIGQLARLINVVAGDSDTRLDDLEERVGTLERKAG
jgi:predicted  nucleic acid-binding Zn-ribbon protein